MQKHTKALGGHIKYLSRKNVLNFNISLTVLSKKVAYLWSMEDSISVDFEIIKRLAFGKTQKEISEDFKREGITPCSYSIIDKRIKALRKEFKCNTTLQMMFKVGQMGLIGGGRVVIKGIIKTNTL